MEASWEGQEALSLSKELTVAACWEKPWNVLPGFVTNVIMQSSDGNSAALPSLTMASALFQFYAIFIEFRCVRLPCHRIHVKMRYLLKKWEALRLLSVMQREEDYSKTAKRWNLFKSASFQLLLFQKKKKKVEAILKERSVNHSWL